jgi:hypothetical protein
MLQLLHRGVRGKIASRSKITQIDAEQHTDISTAQKGHQNDREILWTPQM